MEFNPTKVTSKIMCANKSSGTKLELAAERLLRELDFVLCSGDFESRDVFGCVPDLVCAASRVVVFVHGCFWHGCKIHYKAPKKNFNFWLQKVERNRKRDFKNLRSVRRVGWSALTFWEHDFKTGAGRAKVYGRVVGKIVERSERVVLSDCQ